MDNKKYRKFYLEWWHIRKSTIYGLIALCVLAAAVGGGAWWATRNNWFAQKLDIEIPRDAADRFV